jgi:hypothetical protein
MLRSQLESFFPGQSSHAAYSEFDENESASTDQKATRAGGVWVRKPRSSRKGSGGGCVASARLTGRSVYRLSKFRPLHCSSAARILARCIGRSHGANYRYSYPGFFSRSGGGYAAIKRVGGDQGLRWERRSRVSPDSVYATYY